VRLAVDRHAAGAAPGGDAHGCLAGQAYGEHARTPAEQHPLSALGGGQHDRGPLGARAEVDVAARTAGEVDGLVLGPAGQPDLPPHGVAEHDGQHGRTASPGVAQPGHQVEPFDRRGRRDLGILRCGELVEVAAEVTEPHPDQVGPADEQESGHVAVTADAVRIVAVALAQVVAGTVLRVVVAAIASGPVAPTDEQHTEQGSHRSTSHAGTIPGPPGL
jgi:hypothetical protein